MIVGVHVGPLAELPVVAEKKQPVLLRGGLLKRACVFLMLLNS